MKRMKKMERFNKMNLKKIIFAAAIVLVAWRGISTEMTVSATQVENESSKSPDNSLSSLKLSQGTLSPEFYYSTTSYTATVPYETTSVEVTAKTSNSKAEIESISGASDLQPGENKITITVRAENGAKALYTIKVTRESSPAGTATGEANTGENIGEAGEAPTTGTDTDQATEAPNAGENTGEAGEAPATGDATPEGTGNVESEEYSAQIEEYENRMSLLQKEYEKLEKKYESEKSSARTIIAILIFVLLVVMIAGINIIIFMKRKNEDKEEREELDIDDDNDDDDEDDDWLDEEDEVSFQREMPFIKKKAVDVMETTDDIENIDVIDFDKL